MFPLSADADMVSKKPSCRACGQGMCGKPSRIAGIPGFPAPRSRDPRPASFQAGFIVSPRLFAHNDDNAMIRGGKDFRLDRRSIVKESAR
jgi:hypothetical protein